MLEDHTNSEQALPNGYLLSGRYVLDSFLGSGGMGSVYLAHDKLLEDKIVAIKILHKEFSRDSELTRRFLREVNMMHSVNHPNVVRTYDAGVQDGMFYFTMEYIEGLLLDRYLETLGKDYTLLAKVTVQICKGLEAIHNQNIVHRDLKPGNLLVSNDGVVKITDFGVARPVSSGQTAHREIMGSLDYIPPEVFQGHQISPASDFYSLGVILYGIVCGVFPFEAEDSMAIVWKHVHEIPALPSFRNPEVPPWMDSLIMRLLEKDPTKRPQNAREIIRFVRENVYKDTRLLDSGSHALTDGEQDGEKEYDTDIFEMEIDPSALEANSESLRDLNDSRADSFTSACNQVIFETLPTVEQIRNHEEMWRERKRKRDEGHDLKGLAAKVKQAEKYDEIKRIRRVIQVVGFVVVSSVIISIVAHFTKPGDEAEEDEAKKDYVSIQELRKDYLSGNADTSSRVKPNSVKDKKESSWKLSDLFSGLDSAKYSTVDSLQNLSFKRVAALNKNTEYLLGASDKPAVGNELWSDADRDTAKIGALDERTKQRKQKMREVIQSQPALATVYDNSQATTSAQGLTTKLNEPTEEQKQLYIEKRKLRESLNTIEGQLSAYTITNDSELILKESEAADEIEKLNKIQTSIDSNLSNQIEKQRALSTLIKDLDKGGQFKVAKELAEIDESVAAELKNFDKAQQAYTEMLDSIKDGKSGINKFEVEEAKIELERSRSQLNKILKLAMSQGINGSFKELMDTGVLLDMANERKLLIEIEKASRKNHWEKVKSGQAEDKETIEAKKVELEKRLNEIEQVLPKEEETSIRGLVAIESFGSNTK